MLSLPLTFVDVETTGHSYRYGRIIEVGIIKQIDGKVVDTFNTLINPKTILDPYITLLTGIQSDELERAPSFRDVQDKILELLADSIVVAHNVRFDYGFLKWEFKRLGIDFSSKHLCTVKLARLLYPNIPKYNLDSIIKHFEIKCNQRHRALEDVKVIHNFVNLAAGQFGSKKITSIIESLIKRPSIPSYLNKELIERIPHSPGVYIFYDEKNYPLYIGKSVNLKDRVMSHFNNNLTSSAELKISSQVRSIETVECAGELGSLILESKMIKKYLPQFNKKLRQAKKLIALKKTTNKDGYLTYKICEIDRLPYKEVSDFVRICKSKRQAKEFLNELATDQKLCPKLLGLENSSKQCFWYYLNKCNGACIGKEKTSQYNLRFLESFFKHRIKPWPFSSAIVINEKHDKEESFIVDKWCLLGSYSSKDEIADSYNREYDFDYDTYKILLRYLSSNKNLKNIKKLI